MTLPRRHFLRTGAGVALLTVTGCDDGAGAFLASLARPSVPETPSDRPTAVDLDLVSHALNRLSFGPRPGDWGRVRRLGPSEEEAVAAYVEEQLGPGRIQDSRCIRAVRRLESVHQPAGEMFEYQPALLRRQLVQAAVLRATLSERQLFEVMVQFWTDHFNIDPSKGDAQWLKASDDRDVIRAQALGRFPALLRASAFSPAMLWYLDGRVNRHQSPDDRPNENYARELLELHTLGVQGGYTQRDVMEVARCLTGWTVRSREAFGKGRVEFRKEWHDDGPKQVLGHRIPAGLGPQDFDRVLDLVALHPATAHHLATKLCRRFIEDSPPAAAVAEVADAFLASSGDIPATLRCLVNTRAFRTTRGTKLKRPFHFVVSCLRALEARTDSGKAVLDYLLRLGHSPFGYPTPDGYPEEAAPWLGTLLWRWHFALELAANRLPGTRFEPELLRRRLGDDESLLAHLLGRRACAAEVDAFLAAGRDLGLVLASPAFQRC